MSTIEKTVGTGGDFTDWYTAWLWLLTQVPLSDDVYRFTLISDCTLSGTNTTSLNANGKRLEFLVAPEDQHKGDPTAGFKTYITGSNYLWFPISNDTNSDVLIDGLYIERQSGDATNLWLPSDESGTLEVRNVMVKGIGGLTEVGIRTQFIEGMYAKIHACKIWNCGNQGIGASAGGGITGSHPYRKQLRNVTVWNCGINAAASSKAGVALSFFDIADDAWVIDNVVSARNNPTGSDWATTTTHHIIRNCAHSDGSIDAGATKSYLITPADAFLSLSDSSSDFLKPAPGKALAFNGRSVDTTEDIAGIVMPGVDGMWPIGCHEVPWSTPDVGTLYLRMFMHLLPRARAWFLYHGKRIREFFEGLSGIPEDARTFYDLIWFDVFPQTTRELDTWETQFGLVPGSLSESDRRDRLEAAWQAIGGQSPRYIQDTLQAAGFPVYVHKWWVPGTEPGVGVKSCVTARNPNTYITGSAYVLVNKLYVTRPDWLVLCDEVVAECGEAKALCGNYERNVDDPIEYEIPTDPDEHHYFLYIGGQTFPALASIPSARRGEFEDLCLKICPCQQWLGILVQYT